MARGKDLKPRKRRAYTSNRDYPDGNKPTNIEHVCPVCGGSVILPFGSTERTSLVFDSHECKRRYWTATYKKASATRIRLLERALGCQPIPHTRSVDVLLDAGAIEHVVGDIYHLTATGLQIYNRLTGSELD